MIDITNLTKHFGAVRAVNGISMSVQRGEVLGFLGPNGAGKSTTMKMVTGYLTPTSGHAQVMGFDVVDQPIEVKRRIGYLPEGAPSYGDMTTRAFLNFIGEVRGLTAGERRARIDELINLVELESVIDRPVETLSKGFKRRVGLAQAIFHDPDVLIMDEPTDGLDPNQKHQVRELISRMAAQKAIVISTHILEEVEAICSRAVVIAHGTLVADGTPAELVARASNHNTVVVRASGGVTAPVRAALEALSDVASVTEGDDNTLRIAPKPGTSVALSVTELLRENNVQPDELYVEKGALDQVFRDITQGPHQEAAE